MRYKAAKIFEHFIVYFKSPGGAIYKSDRKKNVDNKLTILRHNALNISEVYGATAFRITLRPRCHTAFDNYTCMLLKKIEYFSKINQIFWIDLPAEFD